jgi:acetyl-CoA synthetase
MAELAPTFDPDRWVPPPDRVDRYRISELVSHLGMADIAELAARAVKDPEWYFPAALEFLGAEWLRPWDLVHDGSDGEPLGRWFVGAGTNVSWLAVDRWGDPGYPAVIWESDDGDTRTLSFPELGVEIRRASAGLRRLGVRRGDVVTMHLPVIPEAVIAMLAVARVGAIVAPAFSGYGVEPLAERLVLAGAKVIVTADGTVRRGKRVDLSSTALRAAAFARTVKHVVVVRRLGDPPPTGPGILGWDELCGLDDGEPAEVLDGSTPWLLAFTSGSTGRPKGAVHTHGGISYGFMLDLGLPLDTRPGDRYFYPADMGWLAGPMGGVGPLTLGATVVLFDGVTDFPAPDRIWKLIEAHRVTHWGLAPTTARMLAVSGPEWVAPYELASLRIMGAAGEPWTLPAWRWLHRHVGRGRVPIINFSGGTEIGGMLVTGYPNVATPGGRFSGPALGIDADVVDERGRSLVGAEGELVVRRSWPHMTQGLWREPERYLASYWSTIPGLWVHGDRAVRHEDGSWEIIGRSDDVLKIAGKRVGPTEMESIVAEVDGVLAAAAVGVPHPTKGQVPVVVVVLAATRKGDVSLPGEVADHVARSFGKPLRPEAVLVVDTMPRTRSGKIHRRVLRGWVSGQDPGDLSTLDNPEIEAAVRAASAPLRAALEVAG